LARRIKKLTVGVEYLDRLWKPDTFVGSKYDSIVDRVALILSKYIQTSFKNR